MKLFHDIGNFDNDFCNKIWREDVTNRQQVGGTRLLNTSGLTVYEQTKHRTHISKMKKVSFIGDKWPIMSMET